MINPFAIHRITFKTIILLVTILFAFHAFASNSRSPNGNIRLLVLGDSLSAGFGIDQNSAWVTLLQQQLQQANHPVSVINASVSGETTLGGLNRLPDLLQQHQPNLLILELGANDGLRGLPIDLMRDNLQQMISLAKKRNIQVLLLGMRLPPNYGPTYTKNFEQAYHTLAQQNQIELLPFFLKNIQDKRELMQADDHHPNAQAQPLLLQNVWPHLQRVLAKISKVSH